MRSPRRRPAVVALVLAVLVSLSVAGAAPAAFADPDDGIVASGEGWTVETAPGGYLVSLVLDEPLPVVDDAPTLVVDGVPIGLATPSADGRTLTVTTPDPRVAEATSVVWAWASGAPEGEGDGTPPVRRGDPVNETLRDQLDALPPLAPIDDPAEPGPYGVAEAEYDFGDEADPLDGMEGVRGEMTGKLYLSDAPGARPVVVLLHGRHVTCGATDPDGDATLAWPCTDGLTDIRSYLGYEGTGEALASYGYDVVSISANAINAYDNTHTRDLGARARGRLVLDTLAMLDDASAGRPVSFQDRAADGSVTTRTLDDAFAYATTRADRPFPGPAITAASLQGRFDLTRVGLMGHSRGGEGVVAAATANEASEHPFGIRSVLPLAPVDFGRMTLPDTVTASFLPYCDGDVADQQGQHYVDDSRRAFDDDVLRSAVWIMGANHNYFNSVWSPGGGFAGAGDDWDEDDTVTSCAAGSPSRLSVAEQYQVGVSYMTGFFRLTLGGEAEFQPLFDGSTRPATTLTPYADVRSIATQPASATSLVADFTDASAFSVEGSAGAEVCVNLTDREILQPEPYCATERQSAQVPHWTPAALAPNVPAFPATRFPWTSPSTDPSGASTGELRIPVPAEMRDASAHTRLTLKAAPDESVGLGTDFDLTVVDEDGAEQRFTASELNPYAVNRMPGADDPLDKIVLQQLTIPTARLTDVDPARIAEIVITPGVGADGTVEGGVYLSDLAFDTPAVGSPGPRARATVNVASTRVEEGDDPGVAYVAMYLDRAATEPVTGYASTIGNIDSGVWSSLTRIVFQPGETCKAVAVPMNGDLSHPPLGTVDLPVNATTTSGGVMGADAFAVLTVRDDDDPAGDSLYGEQGDACAELLASRTPGELGLGSSDALRGGMLELSGSGYRPGETVRLSAGDLDLGAAHADASGALAVPVPVPDTAPLGPGTVEATGLGSERALRADVSILAPTAVSLSVAEPSAVAGQPLTLVATVTGADTNGVVTFVDGPAAGGAGGGLARAMAAPVALGTAAVVDGVATLRLAAGLGAGEHSLVAYFGRTDRAAASSATPLVLAVAPAAGGGGNGSGTGTDPGPGSLAATGADLLVWGPVAAALALTAAGVLLVVRRRRRAPLG